MEASYITLFPLFCVLFELKGISLMEAKSQLDKLTMLQLVTQAKTIQDLKPILLRLIDLM